MRYFYYFTAVILLIVSGSRLSYAQSKIKDGSVSGSSSLPNSNAILELESNTKGMLLPRVALSSLISASPLSAHVAGMLVYNTATSGTAPNNVTPGFYFNDGTKWQKAVNGSSADTTNDSWKDDLTNTQVKLAYLSDGTTPRADSVAFVIKDNGHVGMGTTDPEYDLHLNGKLLVQDTIGGMPDKLAAIYSGFAPFGVNLGVNLAVIDTGAFKTGFDASYVTVTKDRVFMGKTTDVFGATGTTQEFALDDNGNVIMQGKNNDSSLLARIDMDADDASLNISSRDNNNSNAATIQMMPSDSIRFIFNNAGVPSSYAFPRRDGANGEVLTTDGNGALSWANPLAKADTTNDSWKEDATNKRMFTAYKSDGTTARPADSTVVITDNGRMGIGLLAPAYTLDVKGKIGVNGTQTVYNAGALNPNFNGSLFVGNGGQNLSHTTGFDALYNTGVGDGALQDITSGYYNSAFGGGSLEDNTSGFSNSGFGYHTLYKNKTGAYNTAVGGMALNNNENGNYNTVIGQQALMFNVSGSNNVAMGYNTLRGNMASNNTAIGTSTLSANNNGGNNTAIGYNALLRNVAGSNGVAVGYLAQAYANDVTTAWTNTNTAVGTMALRGSTFPGNNTGLGNTALGYSSLLGNTSGNQNTAVGVQSLYSNTTGNLNTAVGDRALNNNTIGNDNTAIGADALQRNVAGGHAVAVGNHAMAFYGASATAFNNNNTAIGYYSMTGSPTVSENTGLGNTAVGHWSLLHNTSGSDNTAIGNGTHHHNLTGSRNVAIGAVALYGNASGEYNVAVGYRAFSGDSIGNKNTGLGAFAGNDLRAITAVDGNNTVIGYNTGRGIVTGVNNTVLGANVTGLSSSLSNNIILADGAGTQRIRVLANGNTGIGNTSPLSRLDIAGYAKLGTADANADALATASDRAGMIRYNSSNKTLQFHNDTSWKSLASGTFDPSVDAWVDDPANNMVKLGTQSNGTTARPSGTEVVVKDDGKVAIGQEVPLYTLDVNGKIGIKNQQTIYNASALGNFPSTLYFGNGGADLVSGDARDITAVGWGSVEKNTTGRSNSALGTQSLAKNTTGSSNTAMGVEALRDNLSATENSAFGMYALRNTTIGSFNTAMGYGTLESNNGGRNGVAIGYESQQYINSTTTAWLNNNTSVGWSALRGNTPASGNTGTGNTVMGYRAMLSNAAGSANTAIGTEAMYSNTNANNNTALGYFAMRAVTTGGNNTALGHNALLDNTQGTYNTVLGAGSGTGITTGANNTILGARVSSLPASLSNNIILADGAGTQRIRVLDNGNTGIGNTSPLSRLDVAGYAKLAATDANADALATASDRAGMVRYNSTTKALQYHDDANWNTATSGLTSYYVEATDRVRVVTGDTASIPGLSQSITLLPGQKKTLVFTITGYVVLDPGSSSTSGYGAFYLMQTTGGTSTKIASAFASVSNEASLSNVPHPCTLLRTITLSTPGTYTFSLKFKSWSGTMYVTNNPTPLGGAITYPNAESNDWDSQTAKMQIMVYDTK